PFGCIGYGPKVNNSFLNYFQIGGAQRAQSEIDFAPGVWAPTPTRGILFWNPHAFNLTDQDTMMHGWLNYMYAADRRYIVHGIFDITHIFAPSGIPPYQKGTRCADYTLSDFTSPHQAQLFTLSSHTHKHGEHFWIMNPPAACSTNQDCDSAPGRNDGVCDACPITGGESTENEMFIPIGQYFVP